MKTLLKTGRVFGGLRIALVTWLLPKQVIVLARLAA